MKLVPIILTATFFLIQSKIEAQVTVPCDVTISATYPNSGGGCVTELQTITNPALTLANTFTFTGAGPTVLSGSLTICAMGDIDSATEFWTIVNESGGIVTTVGGGAQCGAAVCVTIPYTAAELLAWSGNGTISFDANGETAVSPTLCGGDYVSMSLEMCYPEVIPCTGTDVVLTASGQGEYYLAQNNDFNGNR